LTVNFETWIILKVVYTYILLLTALPSTLFDQLALGGVMTVPIIKDGSQYLCLIEKVEGNKAKQTLMMEVDFELLKKSDELKSNEKAASLGDESKAPQ